MLNFLMTMLAFIMGLGILITFHEFGHFWVARRCGVKILCFSVGFGKTLISRTAKDGTEYRIAMIPLGGYVKMLGEQDEVVAPEQLSGAFNQKSVWARIAIVFAGPAFNFIFAFFAYIAVYMIGIQGLVPLIGEIQPGSIAKNAGLQSYSEIVAIDDRPTQTWQQVLNQMIPRIGDTGLLKLSARDPESSDVQTYLLPLTHWDLDSKNPDLIGALGITPFRPEQPAIVSTVTQGSAASKAGLLPNDRIINIAGMPILQWTTLVSELVKRPNIKTELLVIRQGHEEPLKLSITPQAKVMPDGSLSGYIGITMKPIEFPKNLIRTQKYSFIDSLKPAYDQTVYYTVVSFKLIGKMVMGKLSLSTLSSPISMAQGAGATLRIGFQYYLGFLALISISLGVVNLLPIPVLDGGHLFFYAIEVLIKRPVSKKIQEVAMRMGFIFIICLMSISFYNDIVRMM